MKIVVLSWVWFVMLIGCTSVRPTQHTFTKTDSTIIREKLVPVVVPGASVQTTLSKAQLDSLTQALRSMPTNNRTFYVNDPALKTRLSFALDSLGKLIIRCESIEQLYMAKLQEKDSYIYIKDLEIKQQSENFGQKLSSLINAIIAGGVILVVILIVISILLKRYML